MEGDHSVNELVRWVPEVVTMMFMSLDRDVENSLLVWICSREELSLELKSCSHIPCSLMRRSRGGGSGILLKL